jgi:tRNA-specific 2-thiouridylase
LGISATAPLYVVVIEDDSNRVVVGKKDELACTGLVARSVNWLEIPSGDRLEAEVQIRYRAPAVACVIRPYENQACEVYFKEPVMAVTPGQAAVFYRGEQLIGGGWIERALR